MVIAAVAAIKPAGPDVKDATAITVMMEMANKAKARTSNVCLHDLFGLVGMCKHCTS